MFIVLNARQKQKEPHFLHSWLLIFIVFETLEGDYKRLFFFVICALIIWFSFTLLKHKDKLSLQFFGEKTTSSKDQLAYKSDTSSEHI